MGLSLVISSEINGDFSQKSRKNSHYFVPPLTEFPWTWVQTQGSKNQKDGATRWSKKF